MSDTGTPHLRAWRMMTLTGKDSTLTAGSSLMPAAAAASAIRAPTVAEYFSITAPNVVHSNIHPTGDIPSAVTEHRADCLARCVSISGRPVLTIYMVDPTPRQRTIPDTVTSWHGKGEHDGTRPPHRRHSRNLARCILGVVHQPGSFWRVARRDASIHSLDLPAGGARDGYGAFSQDLPCPQPRSPRRFLDCTAPDLTRRGAPRSGGTQ